VVLLGRYNAQGLDNDYELLIRVVEGTDIHLYSVAGLEIINGATDQGSGERSPPAGSRGGAPVEVWGQISHKLTTYFEDNYRKHHLMQRLL